MMSELEKRKLEASILRAKATIADYEIKVLERLEEIDRIKKEIEKQSEVIAVNQKTLEAING